MSTASRGRNGAHDLGRFTADCFTASSRDEGYLVVSFDNRARRRPRAARGGRAVYGAVGVLSSAQQAQACASWRKRRILYRYCAHGDLGLERRRLEHAEPDVPLSGRVQTGIAVAPVADQRHYDTIYQERYMGLPQENAKGYHDGSPINFAEGLTGNLLIIHGSGDDNVHFQGTELLINGWLSWASRSIHGVSEPHARDSTRARDVVPRVQPDARYLEEHVPAGGVAQ